MFEAFKEHVGLNFPELHENRLILACSGGLDSTVMAHLVSQLTSNFVLAHVHFGLRGVESDLDQSFVAKLADQLGCTFLTTRFDTLGYARKHGISTQMAARDLRYNWFQELVSGGSGSLILAAHHADDVLETFFINLNRTTGIDGLSGIAAKKGDIRRPLLIFNRFDLEAYARRNELSWREDSSNSEDYYLRNQIRHSLIPALKAVFPDITSRLLITQGYLQESRQILDTYFSTLKTKLFRLEGNIYLINCAALSKLDPLKPHLYELFRPYGFNDWEAIEGLLNGMTGKEVHSNTHRLLRNRDDLLLKPKEVGSLWKSYPFKFNDTDELPIKLNFKEVVALEEISPEVIYVDKDLLNQTLILRTWRNGDYIYPFGMKGKKRISKYYKDIGLSQFDKETQWLLCSGDDVVWIIGKRADNRFRITPSTRSILKIVWEK